MQTKTRTNKIRKESNFKRKKYSNNKSSFKRNFNGKGNNKPQKSGRKISTFNPLQFINKNPIDKIEEIYNPKHRFSDFNLDIRLNKRLEEMGIKIPSPIQDQIIPEILNGRDVVGLAETGTGKTAAFLLPLIEKNIKDKNHQTLILAPTRELAIQIENELWRISKGLRIFSVTCVGGINIRPQISRLRKQNQFIIGTPGRILDLINRGDIKTEKINTVVLDEADRMLDMGFINDIKKILLNTPKERTTLFFSATMDQKTKTLVNDFLKNPVIISVKKKDVTDSIEQDIIKFEDSSKLNTLVEMFKDESLERVIIFCGMKHSAEKLMKDLNKNLIKSESIHGDKNHGQRQRALKNFKLGESKVLVATDVAARGIHVDNVSHVINYDLPQTFEDYVHRIGRTGRGDKKGKAFTFVKR